MINMINFEMINVPASIIYEKILWRTDIVIRFRIYSP